MKRVLISMLVMLLAVLTKSQAATVVWSGDFYSYWWSSVLDVDASAFSSLKVGDQVVFDGDNNGAKIQIANHDWSSYLTAYDYNCADFYGSYTIDVDAAILAKLQEGIHVKGENLHLRSISAIYKNNRSDSGQGGTSSGGSGQGGSSDQGSTGSGWNGSFDSNWWNSTLDVDGSVFSGLTVGSQVTFVGSTYSYAQIQVASNDWSYFSPSCDEFNGSYTIDINSSNLNFFLGGIHVKGQGFTLQQIVVKSNSGGSSSSSSPSQSKGGFYVEGTKLKDANGNEFIMRGCNYSYAWQKGNEYSVISAAKRIGCNTIRINISNGKKFSYCDNSEISKLIQLCEDNKLVCVLCVHDALGSNDISDLDNTVSYWKSIKEQLVGHESTVIVNIANEWVGQWESGVSEWESGYVKAVKELRAAGINNTFMIDCAGYGQYPGVIGSNGRAVFDADPQKNLMFSIHMYQYDAGTSEQVRNNINQALAIDVPLCIGEFAYSHQGSSIAYQTIMDYCKEKNVGYLVWSWTGNGGGTEACDMFGGYDESDVKENGRVTIWGANGIKATSKECSVFGNYSSAKENVEYGGITADIDHISSGKSSAIDFNKSYEIYNMNGQRVQNMGTSGIYILRQGKASLKVRK